MNFYSILVVAEVEVNVLSFFLLYSGQNLRGAISAKSQFFSPEVISAIINCVESKS